MTRPGAGATRREERRQDRRRGRRVQEWKRRQKGREAPPANVSKMATFLTDMMEKGYTQEEIFNVLFEPEQDRKRRRVQAIVTETVDAHRLRKRRDLLAYEKPATFRRMNGFDRVVEGEENWFHGYRSLPLTPEQHTARLKSELQKLKNAISMPAETVTRPWQKKVDFVDGLTGKLPDEELAVLKRYVEKRSHEAAQTQVTVTPVNTLQHCSPCPPNPDIPSDVCFKLESSEGKMGLELKELESPSAGTGLETPGQQCPPNEGIWETGRTTADGILTAGVGSNQGGSVSVDTRASTKSTATFADISSPTEHVGTLAGTAATPAKCRHKTTSEENKQFDPGGKGEKAPPWNATVTLLSFSGESWEAPCLCFVLCLCFVCAWFPKLLLFSGDHFSAS